LFVLAVHFLHGFQVRRNARSLLSQANRTEQAGDFHKTADYLKRYLELAPQDQDVRARYALLLADQKKMAKSPLALARSFAPLEDALRHNPERHDLRRRIIEVAMELKWYGDAAQHLDRLLLVFPRDATLEVLRGRCYEASGEFKKARKGYSEAIAHAPREIENYARLAYLLRQHTREAMGRESNFAQAIQLADSKIDEMVKVNDRSYQARLLRAHYTKDFIGFTDPGPALKAVEQDVRKAQELAPDAADVLLAVADLARDNKDLKEARASLARGIQRYPDDWRMYRSLARLEIAHQQMDAALHCLRQGLQRLPRQVDLLWNLGFLLIETNHKDEADGVIARLRDEKFPDTDLDYLRARGLFLKEEWLSVIRLLERVYPLLMDRNNQNKDWFALNLAQDASLLLGSCYEQLGDAERAASAYRRVLSRDPRSAVARQGIARMEWVMGRLDTAADEYRRLLKDLPSPPREALVELAHVLIIRNLQRSPAERAKLDNIWAEADQRLKEAEKLVPVPVEVPLLRAEIVFAIAETLDAQGHQDKKREQFIKAHDALVKFHADESTRPAEIWVVLANLKEQREGNAKVALDLLNEAEKYLGDHVELRLAKARYWVRLKGKGGLAGLAPLSRDMEKYNPEERRRLIRGLAKACQQLGDYGQAAALWQKLAAERSNDLASRLSLFDLALHDFVTALNQQGPPSAEALRRHDQRMSRFIGEIRRIEGDEGTLWRYCRACQIVLETKQGAKTNLKEATELLDKSASQRSGWARVPVCQAQVSELLENYDSAIAKYQQAVLLGERDPAVIRRGVELLSARQRYSEADQLLLRLGDQPGAFAGLERVAAEVALRKHDIIQALELAQKAVSADSRDFRDQLWLGQIQWAAGYPEEAPFRRAVALADAEPAAWVGYVQYLARTGERQKALEKTLEAERKLPKDKAPLALAQCYAVLGKHDRAMALYKAALTARPKDLDVLRSVSLYFLNRNQAGKALPYLERIIALKTKNRVQSAWARRVLGMALAAGGDFQQKQRALAVMGLLEGFDPSEASHDEGVEEDRTRAAILASRPGLRERQQAIQILERMRRQQTASASDLFLLAQLYEAVGDWPRAKDQMMGLLLVDEERLGNATGGTKELRAEYGDHLAHLSHRLLFHKEEQLTQAQRWIEKLEKLQPDAFRTLALKARMQARRGRGAEMVPAIVAYVKDKAELLEAGAALLEHIEQKAAANAMYQRFVDQAKQPEAVLVLARFLGRQELAEEALTLCKRALKDCPAEVVGRSAAMVLSTSKPTPEQCRRVAGWLEDALATSPQKEALLDQLAVIRNLEGDSPGIIRIYRRILQQDPTNAKALNNLAWQLALHERKPSEALGIIQKAIELGGPLANRLDTRAVIYLALGQNDQAVKDLQEVITVAESPQAHFHLARAYHQGKEPRKAFQEFQRAKALGLTETTVDPLERSVFRQLLGELEHRGAGVN